MTFRNAEESHAHSLQTLNDFYEHDDFMASIRYLADIGCGSGLDLEWWATRTTRDESREPLNIDCIGVDLFPSLSAARKYNNITYQQTDFEATIHPKLKTKFDVLWCHDAFQYAVDPLKTLRNWWDITSDGGMLAMVIPSTTNVRRSLLDNTSPDLTYYHYTLVNLIHMLAVSGWDCNAGFFKKISNEPWISAVVYKSQHQPLDPKTTSWYQLCELNLLPESAQLSVNKHGYLQQQDLILPWLDKSLIWYGNQ
jgi:SAM-dependent methyltransferase